MKKLLTSALVIALSFGAAQAQQDAARHKGGKHNDKARHEMGYQKLDLSADQQAKIKAINESFRDGMKSLKDQTGLTDAQRKERREALQQKHRTELDAVLTAEQRAKAEAMRKEGKDKDGDKSNRDGKGDKEYDGRRGHGGDMAKELNLSTEQQAKMETIRKETKAKLDAVRADASLTQEQKKAKSGEIMKAQMEQMKSILTKEQQQKMKDGRKGRPGQSRK